MLDSEREQTQTAWNQTAIFEIYATVCDLAREKMFNKNTNSYRKRKRERESKNKNVSHLLWYGATAATAAAVCTACMK